jgi:UDPglucose--hexose-1-phosphate uridylyltransferase
VQVFENKGDVMGCSNHHPHGQIWESDGLPNEIAKEERCQHSYFDAHTSPLLVDYARREQETGERVVASNDYWLAVVPFWAVWPFEMLLLPTHRVARLQDLDDFQRDALSDILRRLLTRYDNLFATSFPYSMGWHGAPFGQSDLPHWHFTHTFIHRCYARLPSRNSWLATSCSLRLSAISLRRWPPSVCAS